MIARKNLVAIATVVLPFLASATLAVAAQDHDSHGHAEHGPAEDASSTTDVVAAPLGFSLAEGWGDPWVHSDFSRRGTPFIHLFGLEPAFLDRDLFLDVVVTSADDEDETELAAELEYAFTRRLGIVAELPVVHLNPEAGETETGLGDAAIAPRAVLIETDRFLLAANLDVTLPTGSESRGLGGGEVALAPSVSTWLDLGNWVTLSTQFGTEHGLETGDSELFYSAALTYSFQGPALLNGTAHVHGDHAAESHMPFGLTSLLLEYTGRTGLSGEDDNRNTAEILFGVSHTLNESLEVRGAYQLPVGGTEDIDYSYVLSVIYHF